MQKRHNGIRRISLSFSLPKVSSRTWGTVTKDWIDEKPTRWLASLKSVAHSSWLISTPRWLAWAFWWLVRSTRIPNASHSQQISLLRNTFDIHVSLIPLLLVTKRKKKKQSKFYTYCATLLILLMGRLLFIGGKSAGAWLTYVLDLVPHR